MSTKQRVAAALLTVSLAGIVGIRHDEGEVRRVYLDPVGIPTVCVGHTATVSRKDVGRTYTGAECEVLLRQDLRDAERAVKRRVRVPITQGQYDSLVSFTFNVGEGNLAASTLLRKLNAGQCLAAADQFGRWVYAKGVKLPGLVKRRAAEEARFREGCTDDPQIPDRGRPGPDLAAVRRAGLDAPETLTGA